VGTVLDQYGVEHGDKHRNDLGVVLSNLLKRVVRRSILEGSEEQDIFNPRYHTAQAHGVSDIAEPALSSVQKKNLRQAR
jgi:hypothetical protein